MKRSFAAAAFLLSASMLLGACSGSTGTADARADAIISSIVQDFPDTTMSAGGGTTAAVQPAPGETAPAQETTVMEPYDIDPATLGDETVNIDLTQMTSTMIYSVIYDIVTTPERYYGKTLMLDGYFDTAYDERLDTRYYFVVVPDAAACCMQGLEFILDGDRSYPDDYPEVRSDIRLRGVLDHYDEEGNTYCYIKADSVTLI